eukprot:TRINITY_DN3696_c2_g1_i1.p1 TRINITY_DN3696_c2_g1~~TRINITY_DN3696_c2_g1_i1.p1  ORF type:complete len:724 (+),score=137.46 TRINITY_DN3696_c2_g1_i1:258-2174(+)
MAHRVQSYYVPTRKESLAGTGAGSGVPQSPFDSSSPSRPQAPFYGLLNMQVKLSPGQGLAMMESNLNHAPIFKQKPQSTDFLLIGNRSKAGGVCSLTLRRLSKVFVVGQNHPKVQIPDPNSSAFWEQRSACIRQLVQCAIQRFIEKGKSLDRSNDKKNFLSRVKKWLLSHRDHKIVSEVLQDWEKGVERDDDEWTQKVCALESAMRAEKRLASLGICDSLITNRRLSSCVKELRDLENSKPYLPDPLAPRARWILEQVQMTSWWQTSAYRQWLKEQKRCPFLISGPGDPSGCRGEAVSLLPAPSASQFCTDLPTHMQHQKMTSSELRSALLRAGVPKTLFGPLCRPDRTALLLDHEKKGARTQQHEEATSSSGKSQAETRQLWERLLRETFQRQVQALSSDVEVESEDSASDATAAEGDEQALLDALEFEDELSQGKGAVTPDSQLDEAAEFARFRRSFTNEGGRGDQNEEVVAPAKPEDKVPMLKVCTVEKNQLGHFVERVLYVFGEENIKLYRKQQEKAAQTAAEVAAWSAEGQGASDAFNKGRHGTVRSRSKGVSDNGKTRFSNTRLSASAASGSSVTNPSKRKASDAAERSQPAKLGKVAKPKSSASTQESRSETPKAPTGPSESRPRPKLRIR